MTNIKITTFEHDGKTYELVTDPDSIKVGQDVYVFDEYYQKVYGHPKRQEVITSSDHYTDFTNQAPESLVRDWVKGNVIYSRPTPTNPVGRSTSDNVAHPIGRTSSSELLHPHQKLIIAKKKYPDLVIEFLNYAGDWEKINSPAWVPYIKYRIQPKREVKYVLLMKPVWEFQDQ